MKRTIPLLSLASLAAFASLGLSLVACSDSPDVEATITPLACGRLTCDLDRPLGVGSKLAFEPAPLGLVASVRVSNPAIATVAPGFLQAAEGYTVTAGAAGRVTVELLDDDGEIIGSRELEVAAADHLEATITVIGPTGTAQLDRVTAEQPQSVPATSTVRISVDQRRGADPLLGWSEYEVEPTLTNGARVVRWDREGNATLEIRAGGDQAVRFRSTSTALDSRFVLAAR